MGYFCSMRFNYLWLLPAALCAQTGTVSVEVRDAITNTPVVGVVLKLARSSAPMTTWSARTDVDGKASFDHLPAGSFYVEATHEGYLDSKFPASQYVLISKWKSAPHR